MIEYYSLELADMHSVYNLADGNGEQARRNYHQRYPNRSWPDNSIFSHLIRNFVKTGTIRKGASRSSKILEIVKMVLNEEWGKFQCHNRSPFSTIMFG